MRAAEVYWTPLSPSPTGPTHSQTLFQSFHSFTHSFILPLVHSFTRLRVEQHSHSHLEPTSRQTEGERER